LHSKWAQKLTIFDDLSPPTDLYFFLKKSQLVNFLAHFPWAAPASGALPPGRPPTSAGSPPNFRAPPPTGNWSTFWPTGNWSTGGQLANPGSTGQSGPGNWQTFFCIFFPRFWPSSIGQLANPGVNWSTPGPATGNHFLGFLFFLFFFFFRGAAGGTSGGRITAI
jgi:hypothetical protein